MTLVWSMWKVDEAGSWLKSIETFGCVGVGEDALELLLGGALRIAVVDLVLRGRRSGDELEVDHRHVRSRHADGDAVELAVEFRQHEADRLRRARRGRDHRQAAARAR